MKKKSAKVKSSGKNNPLSIEDHPIGKDFKVQGEIVSEYQEISQVSVKKQSPKTEHLKPYQFTPGESGNPSGRSPDLVKAIAKRIAHLKAGKILSEKELDKLKRLGLDQADITVIESIIIDWATSGNPVKQQMYVERVAGKVPNININTEISASLVARFKSKFTDSELERIASGEDALEILVEKLPDANDETIDIQAEEYES